MVEQLALNQNTVQEKKQFDSKNEESLIDFLSATCSKEFICLLALASIDVMGNALCSSVENYLISDVNTSGHLLQ